MHYYPFPLYTQSLPWLTAIVPSSFRIIREGIPVTPIDEAS